MRVSVKGNISDFADIRGLCREIIKKGFGCLHCCFISGGSSEAFIHGVGNIHDNDDGHVRLAAKLINIIFCFHLQGNVKDILQFRSRYRLADLNPSVLRDARSAGVCNLNSWRLLIFLCVCNIKSETNHQNAQRAHCGKFYDRHALSHSITPCMLLPLF